MLKHFFSIALRTLGRNKVYSFINVLGLTLGICACLTVFLIVNYEFSFDNFHPDGNRIFRLAVEGTNDGEAWSGNSVPAPTALAVRQEISGIEAVTAFHHYTPVIKIPDGANAKQFEAPHGTVIITDEEYFTIFKYDWIAGDPAVMNKAFQVVITDTKAHYYFGDLPADKILGKEILYDSLVVTVAGIVEHWSQNTDFPASDFISLPTISSSKLRNSIAVESWTTNMHSSQAYVKMSSGGSALLLKKLLTDLIRKYDTNSAGDKSRTIGMGLQPLSDIHLNPDNSISPTLLPTLYILIGLALFILAIAIINFVNLSTAQSIHRAKEIGIRKVLGTLTRGLIIQFISETFVLTFIAVLSAALLVNPVLSWFSDFVPAGVRFDLFSPSAIVFLILITIITSVLAGFYPGKVLSSYAPSMVLKGSGYVKAMNGGTLRKALIIFQFSMSLFFIAASIVINGQIKFIQGKDKGFSTQDILTVRAKWDAPWDRVKVLSERIKQLAGVEEVALQGLPPMGFGLWFGPFRYIGKNPVEVNASIKPCTSDFIPFYKFHLIAGRNIAATDTLYEVAINQRFVKELAISSPEDAVGQSITYNGKNYPIVGVVKDFHEQSFHDPISPTIIGNFRFDARSIAVKIPSENREHFDRKQLLSEIENEYKKVFPDEPFNANLMEDEIGWMHERDQRTATLVTVSMLITILISTMGIFGLSMFTCEMRLKEIGIRKVLGASVISIASLLSKEFILLIIIAVTLTIPITWYFVGNWLAEFTYHIDITVWTFIVSAIIALTIGLLVISFRTITAALTNPIEILRSD